MPPRREDEDVSARSDRVIREARILRELSDRLLAEIDALRSLESRARELEIGSPEFEQVSQEITDRVRGVFRLSAEQEALGAEARQQNRAINDVPPSEGG